MCLSDAYMEFGLWAGDETVKVLDQRRCSDQILRNHNVTGQNTKEID